MTAYCENTFCQNEAIKKVRVSVDKPGDRVVAMCALCEEAYTWGVQHGRATAHHESQSQRGEAARKS